MSAAVLNLVRSQQCGVRVSSGVESCIWGVKLWIEEKLGRSERSVVLEFDLASLHAKRRVGFLAGMALLQKKLFVVAATHQDEITLRRTV